MNVIYRAFLPRRRHPIPLRGVILVICILRIPELCLSRSIFISHSPSGESPSQRGWFVASPFYAALPLCFVFGNMADGCSRIYNAPGLVLGPLIFEFGGVGV
ncbi:hypothetical protein, unlikely [Trypanosoma brucei gambiense DAL972]|uniref:Uncharacterized protein n=1 Tax=Trypanosoma brucei gambiense (strain MHOM/CI/86/DAL972) TaxID=679716 RepID=C9ZPC1_TRYB9|nr:hypothetical protein, unlikely [Trypanosoma brucei gambiense DAL972]CBH11249.1 hypothetical protein, unlikely [Trypanosoma brucei gambiense DAL972]|eukprot:XP_011773536.1 hypothetical protein, unlikely [Trypanosoma brucei gambiense DAL972]